MKTSSVIVCGLQASGKTTFLAALCHKLENPDLNSPVLIEKLDDDMAYVNRIVEDWVNGKPLGRTARGKINPISLHLMDAHKNSIGKTVFPDISGEEFEAIWQHRQLNRDFAEKIKLSDSMCFFIHPVNKWKNNPQLVEVKSSEFSFQIKNDPIAWSEDLTETQVVLTQIFQDLFKLIDENKKYKIAIVISAWDIVKKIEDLDPYNWFSNYLPLLKQYLDSRNNNVSFNIFGISAQGGELDDPDLIKKDPPESRVMVVNNKIETCDVCLPLIWLLGL